MDKHQTFNKVLNGNISGKEYERNGEKQIGNDANNITKANLQTIFAGTGEELLKLGEGTFEIEISRATDDITIEIWDESEFNGGKKYMMDSLTFKQPANNNTTETVEIAGITLSLKGFDNNTPPADKSEGFEFTNSVSKEEEGIRLQVGANREQMDRIECGEHEEQGVRARRDRCNRSRKCGGSDREDR